MLGSIFLFGRFFFFLFCFVFLFLHFECIISPFWSAKFLLKNLLIGGCLVPSCFSLVAFKILSLYLTVDTLIVMSHHVGLFGFPLFELSRFLECRCLFAQVRKLFSSSFFT